MKKHLIANLFFAMQKDLCDGMSRVELAKTLKFGISFCIKLSFEEMNSGLEFRISLRKNFRAKNSILNTQTILKLSVLIAC